VHTNPFAHLPVAKGIAKRERVLSDAEIGEIWRGAADAGAPYGSIIRLLILTGQRRGEVAGMNWAEISDDLATWTISGELSVVLPPEPFSRARGTAISVFPNVPVSVRTRLPCRWPVTTAAESLDCDAYARCHWLGGKRVKVKSGSPASSRLLATALCLSRHLRMKALRCFSISSGVSA
jgi:hypothetical protein